MQYLFSDNRVLITQQLCQSCFECHAARDFLAVNWFVHLARLRDLARIQKQQSFGFDQCFEPTVFTK